MGVAGTTCLTLAKKIENVLRMPVDLITHTLSQLHRHTGYVCFHMVATQGNKLERVQPPSPIHEIPRLKRFKMAAN